MRWGARDVLHPEAQVAGSLGPTHPHGFKGGYGLDHVAS